MFDIVLTYSAAFFVVLRFLDNIREVFGGLIEGFVILRLIVLIFCSIKRY